MNRIKLGGNLGADVVLRSTGNGLPVASVRLATGKKFKDRAGTQREEVQWHTVVLWGDMALDCARVTKGTRLDVEGELKYREYEGKDGVKHIAAEVHALSVTVVRRMSVARRETAEAETPAGS